MNLGLLRSGLRFQVKSVVWLRSKLRFQVKSAVWLRSKLRFQVKSAVWLWSSLHPTRALLPNCDMSHVFNFIGTYSQLRTHSSIFRRRQ